MIRTTAARLRDPAQAEAAAAAAPLLLLLPMIGYYALLLTAAGSVGLFAPVTYGRVFNSMLLHLLHGRFDVDPAAIGYEGYLRDGAVYAYFGILPALLRAPLLLLRDFAATDFTRLSCLTAAALMALCKLLCVRTVWRAAGAPARSPLLPVFVVTILLSGPQIEFLRPSVYQETILWADACAAAFVLLVVHGWTRRDGFGGGLLTGLAALAGLCLLTRVSTALGLYGAVGLIGLWRLGRQIRGGGSWLAGLRSLAPPLAVLGAFVATAALVNYGRWGNPLVFVDLRDSLQFQAHGADFHRLTNYGVFNPIRLGYGLSYYFLPVWALRDVSGQLAWLASADRVVGTIELPPSSFLLSDPLLFGMAVYGARHLVAGGAVARRAPVALAAAALTVPPLLMLMFIAMTFRYRVEFYPLFELCAFVGLRCLLSPSPPGRRLVVVLAVAACAGIVAAHLLWLLYMLSPFGTASERLGHHGIVQFYACLLQHCPSLPGAMGGGQ